MLVKEAPGVVQISTCFRIFSACKYGPSIPASYLKIPFYTAIVCMDSNNYHMLCFQGIVFASCGIECVHDYAFHGLFNISSLSILYNNLTEAPKLHSLKESLTTGRSRQINNYVFLKPRTKSKLLWQEYAYIPRWRDKGTETVDFTLVLTELDSSMKLTRITKCENGFENFVINLWLIISFHFFCLCTVPCISVSMYKVKSDFR